MLEMSQDFGDYPDCGLETVGSVAGRACPKTELEVFGVVDLIHHLLDLLWVEPCSSHFGYSPSLVNLHTNYRWTLITIVSLIRLEKGKMPVLG